MNTVVNFINLQTATIGEFANIGDKYIILNESTNSLSDSSIDANTTSYLNPNEIKYAYPQKILTANLHANSENYPITILGVSNVTAFLRNQNAYLNGSAAKTQTDANIGELLAKTTTLNLQNQPTISFDNSNLTITITGITRTNTQADNQLIVPIETARILTNNYNLSFIEFAFKEDINKQAALNNLTNTLPANLQIIKIQHTIPFIQETTQQTITFLTIWSIIVYIVIAAASYVISTRLVVESKYELTTLKTIGAKRKHIFTLIFSYTIITALVGSILGIAIGIVGTQIASTALRWTQNITITPFLEPTQIQQILLLSLLFSTLGCLYPVIQSIKTKQIIKQNTSNN